MNLQTWGNDVASISERASVRVQSEPLITSSSPLGRGWYVVYTVPQAEHKVAKELRRIGFDVFLPCETRARVVHGKRRKISGPLFSRYVFVGFDPAREEWWEPIGSTDGVVELLQNNRSPVRIPTKVIAALQLAEANGAFDKDKLPVQGEEFRVVDGPLAGMIGKIKSARASGRVKLLVNLLGKMVAAEFAIDKLERIS